MLPARLNIGAAFFTAGVFSVGAMALSVPKGYSIGFYAITFVSLFLWLRYKGNREYGVGLKIEPDDRLKINRSLDESWFKEATG